MSNPQTVTIPSRELTGSLKLVWSNKHDRSEYSRRICSLELWTSIVYSSFIRTGDDSQRVISTYVNSGRVRRVLVVECMSE